MPSPTGALFIDGLNVIPGIALYVIGKLSKNAPLAFWGAVAASAGFALWAHSSMNLAASSTAAIGLLFIPIYCAAFATAGTVLGWVVQKAVQPEPVRRLIAWVACVGAVILPLGSVMQGARRGGFPRFARDGGSNRLSSTPRGPQPRGGFSKKKHSGRNACAMYSMSFADTPQAWKWSRQARTVVTTLSISTLAASTLSPKRSHWVSRL
jgi:hypothetical protein